MKFWCFVMILVFLIYIKHLKKEFGIYKNYINDCKNLKIINEKDKNKENEGFPLLSICIPLYNMKKYLGRALLTFVYL